MSGGDGNKGLVNSLERINMTFQIGCKSQIIDFRIGLGQGEIQIQEYINYHFHVYPRI